MRTDPQLLVRSFAKFVAIAIAAVLGGAGIGVVLGTLTGDDDTIVPPLSTTTSASPEQASTAPDPVTRTQTTARATQTETSAGTGTSQTEPARTTTATGTTQTTATSIPAFRVPRVQVLSAALGATSQTTGHARVTARVRVTNRGSRPLTLRTPVLISGPDEVPLDSAAREAARPLLRSLAPGASATGVLRFTAPGVLTQRLSAALSARLRIANRTILVKLTTSVPQSP